LENGGAHVYFAGHEHDLQHQRIPSGLDHIVSGAGSELRPTGMMEYSKFAASTRGFVSTTITADSLFHQFIDEGGIMRYAFSTYHEN
jgi:hypothetical protein